MTYYALVVVPAHQEEETIVDCIQSIDVASHAAQALAKDMGYCLEVHLVVVADSCSDETVLRARACSTGSVKTHIVEVRCRNVGAVRTKGILTGLQLIGAENSGILDTNRVWVLNTDADSKVSPQWIIAHLRWVGLAEIVLGTVVPEWGSHHSPQLVAEYDRLYNHRNGHRHIHGANISFPANVFSLANGFPARKESEDVEMVRKLTARGARTVSISDGPVYTSTRASDRTPGGFSGFIANLSLALPITSHAEKPTKQCPSVFTSTDSEDEVVEF